MSNFKNSHGNPSDFSSLQMYFKDIWEHDILTAEEEAKLVSLWYDKGNVSAKNKIITTHLRLVVKVANNHKRYGLPLEDIIAEGNLGLIKALDNFDASKGYRFSTYAMWWIKAFIIDYILNNWSMVKTSSLSIQKKLFFKLKPIKKQLGIQETGELTDDEVSTLSKELGVSKKNVVNFNRTSGQKDLSLNITVGEDGTTELQDIIDTEQKSPEDIVGGEELNAKRKAILLSTMSELPTREQEILAMRWLSEKKETLEFIGEKYGISRERVRQIEKKSLKKLKSILSTSFNFKENFILD